MRAMVLAPGPAFSVADVHRGWVKGLRANGVEVFDFNLDARINVYSAVELTVEGVTKKAFSQEAAWQLTMEGIYSEAFKWWPDLVVVITGYMVSGDVLCNLQSRGFKVAHVFTESPYEDITQIEKSAQPDLVVINDPTNLHRFQAANPTAYYQPHSYDPEVHYPGPATPGLESEFAFVGTGYPSRVEFFESVDWTGIDAVLGGHWKNLDDSSPIRQFLGHEPEQCVDNKDAIEVYRSTLMSANLYRAKGATHGLEAEQADLMDGWAMGPREVELAAVGCPFITQERGENREVLPMVPTFETPEEFGDLIRWYLAHPKERAVLAGAARAAIADRTFTNAAARMLRALDRLPVSA